MKRIIKKFWGVGLVLMLLSTLFIAAAPVSAADPLNWEPKIDAPSGMFSVLAPGTDVLDYDVNGMIMYAATGTALMQSTLGGSMWTNITTRLPAAVLSVDYVAMAPDDPNVVLVASNTAPTGVAISTNGGATFSSMLFPGTATDFIYGLTVSPTVSGGFRYISVFGRNAAADTSVLYYYNYGAGVGAWRNAVTDFNVLGLPSANATMDNIVAFKFSPNFPSDFMAVALSEDDGGVTTGTLRYHVLSFNSFKWDVPVAAGYPVPILSSANATNAFTVSKASIALLPDYDGGDESLRIAFVGASVNGTVGEWGGVWRCYDSAPAGKVFGSTIDGSGTGIASVAFDGTNLAAGAYATNTVYRSADPLGSSPTFLGARNYKKIGVDDIVGLDANDTVIIKFDGATLYGAKIGDGSAISKSLDYGNVWNDFTLMDSAMTAIGDIYMSAAGDPWYVSANDSITTSIYRISMFAVTRVLCVYPADATNFMLRGIKSDAGVIFAGDQTTPWTTIFYSADGGQTRWYKRIAPIAITTMEAESATTLYIGNGINVYKSTNSGFTWALPVNCKLGGGNTVYTMVSLGEAKLVVGGTAGGVVWSTDGGATWFPAMGVIGGGPMIVAASGLAAGDYVFAADAGNTNIYRAIVGPTNPVGEFKSMFAPAATVGETNQGLVLTNGVLYALSNNGTAGSSSYLIRTQAPTIPGTHAAIFWGTQYAEGPLVFNKAPTALKVSTGAPGSIMLYAVDTTLFFGAQSVYYYDDTLALNGPKLVGPADKTRVAIVSPLTGAASQVNFTWSRISKATGYMLFIALDPMFSEGFAPIFVGTPAAPNALDPVSQIQGGTTFQAGTTYYWRVSAYLPIGSGFSETRSFTVAPTEASVPAISSPANGVTIESTKPAFSWSPVSGATMYQFQLSEGTAFAAPIYDAQVPNAGAQLPLTVTLEQGKTYFWRVRSFAPVQGDWSAIANFTVATPAPVVEPTPPVVIQQMPAPIINIPAAPPATQITIPPAPAEKVINPTYIWAIIIIGAVLVIAVIVLIVRTRRSV